MWWLGDTYPRLMWWLGDTYPRLMWCISDAYPRLMWWIGDAYPRLMWWLGDTYPRLMWWLGDTYPRLMWCISDTYPRLMWWMGDCWMAVSRISPRWLPSPRSPGNAEPHDWTVRSFSCHNTHSSYCNQGIWFVEKECILNIEWGILIYSVLRKDAGHFKIYLSKKVN